MSLTPPRHVPWSVRTRVVFGGANALFSGGVIFAVLVAAMTQTWGGALIVLAFIAGWIASLRQRRRSVRLLAHGRIGFATLTEKQELRGRRSSKLYVLRFSFDDHGVTRTIEVRTYQPRALIDDRSEQIVYLPDEPDRAELVDALPGQPRVSLDGTIAPHGAASAVMGLTLFVLALLTVPFGVLLWLR